MMNITAEHHNGKFILLNKGRKIGSYATWPGFNQAANNLAEVREQLERLEECRDCNPNEETR
jgi:hypothetical protein